MTPEEKTKELIQRISLWVDDKDTVIDLAELFSKIIIEDLEENTSTYNYWENVKKEIQKL